MKCQSGLVLLVLLILAALSLPMARGQRGNLPWGVERIRGDLPWDADGNLVVDADKKAGEGVVVAVLDSGIWPYHPDLLGQATNGVSFVEGEVWYEDFRGHGTRVAGIIAAMDNGNHLIGVAPEVTLLTVKVTDRNDRIDPSDVVSGIGWAVDNGADIIVMSFRITEHSAAVENACNAAYNSGVLLVAASGNNPPQPVAYPAAYDSVLAVGATDPDDNWSYSNYGPELDFAAPGLYINTTNSDLATPPGLYVLDSGSSISAPHVAGAAALLLCSKVDPDYDFDSDRQWDNTEVIQKLEDTTLDLGVSGFDDYFGYGLVNAWYSYQRPQGDLDYNLFVDIRDLRRVYYYLTYTPENPYWWLARPSDINIDNIVNIADATIVSLHYGQRDP